MNEDNRYQVVIAGGGPVGLFLGICLEKWGIACRILEKRPKPKSGSRSLGIHPVSLELFRKVDPSMIAPFLNQGVKIIRGHAFDGNRKLGTLSFTGCPKPFNYILSLPQHQTERILRKKLYSLNERALSLGTEVTGFSERENHVQISCLQGQRPVVLRSDLLIGCDGKNSFIRQQAGIPFKGRHYPDTYIMGDFTDNTPFGSDAAVFLTPQGLIESFPLPADRRRWVIKTQKYLPHVRREDIEQRIFHRINHRLSDTKNYMLSSFGVQKYIAGCMSQKHLALAGDAAHVVSPIGGQGMNLGWAGAWDLALCIKEILESNRSLQCLKKFEERRKKAARRAIRRAELNMRLGRQSKLPMLRNSLIYLMLNTPLSALVARLFTMRGLDRWVI